MILSHSCRFLIIVPALIWSVPLFAQEKGESNPFPGERRAAVCLTYDDGLDCHLDVAAPALELFDFRGTFYCTGNAPSLAIRMEEWRSLSARGHELGNHTLFHPCHGDKFDWVLPEYDLNNYTLGRLMNELRVANSLLLAVDGKRERSFAYTCANYSIAGSSFVDSMRVLFPAARGGGDMLPLDEIDLFTTPAWGVNDPTGEELIAYVEDALKQGTVAVFMFHSLGGGYLNVSDEAHLTLLQYLDRNRDIIWTAPFLEVMNYVKISR